MRIGLLTTSFPRFEGDVAGAFVLGFARSLVTLGHSVEVLAPEPHETRFSEPPRFDGIEVRWLRYAPRPLERTFYGAGVIDNVRRDPSAVLGLAPFSAVMTREALRRNAAWDAIVSHWALPSALVAGLVRGERAHLAVLHSADVFLLEHLPLRAQLAQRIAAGATSLVFVSRNLRERFLALLPPVARVEVASRAHVCAMGIEPAQQRTRGARNGRLSVLSLGRLVPIKGLEDAIAACARLEHVELVIAGDGPARTQLEALAARLNALVRFTGEVRGAQKEQLFAEADVFVLPSRHLDSGRTEGMPTTVLEAMDHGLPVIATDAGGIRDVVRDGENGLLVPPGDVHALASAIERLRDPTLAARLSKEAEETAREFHWDTLGPRFEALLVEGREENRQDAKA